MGDVWLWIMGLFLLIVICQRWFWLILFGVGGLAAFFSMIASIFSFQIIAAIGLFFLMILLWWLTSLVAEGYQ